MLLRRLVICLSMLFAAPAFADRIYADDGVSLANFFLSEGLEVEVDVDGYGDPVLFVEGRGSKVFTVYFYDCDNNTDCLSIQFYKAFVHSSLPPAGEFWEINRSHRYVRAFVDGDGDPAQEMDIYLGRDGLSEGEFWGLYDQWLDAADDFYDAFSRE